MKFDRKYSYTAITTAITTAVAGAGMATLAGCLPPPATKFELFYHIAPWAGTGNATVNSWNPETGATEVVFAEWGNPLYQQPNGANFFANRYRAPDGGWALHVSGNPTPLNFGNTRGLGMQWAPDGKHIVLQEAQDVIVINSDGTTQTVVGTVGRNPANRYADQAFPRWSQDGTWLAYANSGALEAVNVRTNAKLAFPSLGEDGSLIPTRWLKGGKKVLVRAMGGNYPLYIFDVNNVAEGQEAFINREPTGQIDTSSADSWSPDGDRVIQQFQPAEGADFSYALVFADNRANVPLFTVPEGANFTGGFRWPAWSADGDRLAYVTDVDNDGDEDVVIANKNGKVLQTFNDFGDVDDATLSWSPDRSKLLVSINVKAVPAPSGNERASVIALDAGTVTPIDIQPINDNFISSRITWSPNSRYFVHGYQYASAAFFAGGTSLVDTENLAAGGIAISGRNFVWAPDSSYVAVAQSTIASSICSAAVVRLDDSAHTVIPVAPITSCSAFWVQSDKR